MDQLPWTQPNCLIPGATVSPRGSGTLELPVPANDIPLSDVLHPHHMGM